MNKIEGGAMGRTRFTCMCKYSDPQCLQNNHSGRGLGQLESMKNTRKKEKKKKRGDELLLPELSEWWATEKGGGGMGIYTQWMARNRVVTLARWRELPSAILLSPARPPLHRASQARGKRSTPTYLWSLAEGPFLHERSLARRLVLKTKHPTSAPRGTGSPKCR